MLADAPDVSTHPQLPSFRPAVPTASPARRARRRPAGRQACGVHDRRNVADSPPGESDLVGEVRGLETGSGGVHRASHYGSCWSSRPCACGQAQHFRWSATWVRCTGRPTFAGDCRADPSRSLRKAPSCARDPAWKRTWDGAYFPPRGEYDICHAPDMTSTADIMTKCSTRGEGTPASWRP